MAGGHQGDAAAPTSIDVQARLAADADLPWKALLRTWRPAVPIILAAEGTAIAGGTELLGATEIRVAGASRQVRHLRGAAGRCTRWAAPPSASRARSPTPWRASCC